MLCPICKKNEASKPHACPYQEDVHDSDNDEYCTCCDDCSCDDCKRECFEDI